MTEMESWRDHSKRELLYINLLYILQWGFLSTGLQNFSDGFLAHQRLAGAVFGHAKEVVGKSC